jgi:hypothetical protein
MPNMKQSDVDELEELRAFKANLPQPQSGRVINSHTHRTQIRIEMNEDGSALITVDRDGHRVHRIDVSEEPVDKVGS